MTNEEAIKYLIQPFATSTKSYNEYLKQKEAYELAIKALEERQKGKPKDKWVEFAHFVAGSIFDDDLEDEKDFFIEVACRKLVELGIVELVDGNYQYDYGEEEENE